MKTSGPLFKKSALKYVALLLTLGWLVGCSPPNAYITNTGSDTVSVINTATDRVVATIPVGNAPQGAAVLPDGSRVYVTNFADGTISVIDADTNSILDTISLGYPGPQAGVGLTVTPDGTRVYVGDDKENVTVIDTATNLVDDVIPGFNQSFNVAMHPDGSKVYVAELWIVDNKIIDTATNTVLPTTFSGSGLTRSIAVHPDGSKIYVSEAASGVLVIDTVAYALIATIDLPESGEEERGIAIHPDGSRVYATYHDYSTGFPGEGWVSVIDTSSDTEIDKIRVGDHPIGIDVLPDGSKVYVANNGSNTVSVIDTATNTVRRTIPVGDGPRAYGKFIGP